jgi:hypothetical protein
LYGYWWMTGYPEVPAKMRGTGDRVHDPEAKEQTSVKQDDTALT